MTGDRVIPVEVLDEVRAELLAQHVQWGEQNHPDGTAPTDDRVAAAVRAKARTDRCARLGTLTWEDILDEEVREAFAESNPNRLRTELIQVAAVCVQWVGAIDRRRTDEGAASLERHIDELEQAGQPVGDDR